MRARCVYAPAKTGRRRFLRSGLLGLLGMPLLGGLGWGADPAPKSAAPPALSSATLTCEDLDYFPSENRVEARGNAVLTSSGTRLCADALTLHLSSRTAEAVGHVVLEDESLTLFSDEAGYDWAQSTGSLRNVFLQQGPFRIWARDMKRLGPELFLLERVAFTSCDLNPPHYHTRGGTAKYQVNKRMSVSNVRFAAEDTPLFYVPYYSRSFQDNRWTLTIDPGNSARNGLSAKTVFSYPVGTSARASILWDYYSRAGNGLGAEYTYANSKVRGSLEGYTINDRITDERRWNLRFGHWQQLTPLWQVQSNVAFQSDEDVNNEYIGDDYQRTRQLGESDIAFTRTGSWYTGRFLAEHDRALDEATGRFVTAKTILPQFSGQTSAIRLGRSSAYVQGSANFRNEYDRPEATPPDPNPILPGKDTFRQYADGTGSIRWRVPVTRNISLEPSTGLSEQWQSHQDLATELDPQDITQGRGFTGLNLRHRLTSTLDYDLTHRYKVRWRPNTFRRDHGADDHGVESNDLSFFGSWRPSRGVWGRLSTGYDFRDAPDPGYINARQRWTPPVAELNLRPSGWWSASLRETVQLYPARKPQSTQASGRIGRDDRAFFSSGFSYNVNRQGQLDLTHGAAFNLTRGWWLSGDIHYTALGSGGLHYNRVDFKEKNLVVRRDLHCWTVRVSYRERPGVSELYFRLDLKTNAQLRESRKIEGEEQFHPARDTRGEY